MLLRSQLTQFVNNIQDFLTEQRDLRPRALHNTPSVNIKFSLIFSGYVIDIMGYLVHVSGLKASIDDVIYFGTRLVHQLQSWFGYQGPVIQFATETQRIAVDRFHRQFAHYEPLSWLKSSAGLLVASWLQNMDPSDYVDKDKSAQAIHEMCQQKSSQSIRWSPQISHIKDANQAWTRALQSYISVFDSVQKVGHESDQSSLMTAQGATSASTHAKKDPIATAIRSGHFRGSMQELSRATAAAASTAFSAALWGSVTDFVEVPYFSSSFFSSLPAWIAKKVSAECAPDSTNMQEPLQAAASKCLKELKHFYATSVPHQSYYLSPLQAARPPESRQYKAAAPKLCETESKTLFDGLAADDSCDFYIDDEDEDRYFDAQFGFSSPSQSFALPSLPPMPFALTASMPPASLPMPVASPVGSPAAKHHKISRS